MIWLVVTSGKCRMICRGEKASLPSYRAALGWWTITRCSGCAIWRNWIPDGVSNPNLLGNMEVSGFIRCCHSRRHVLKYCFLFIRAESTPPFSVTAVHLPEQLVERREVIPNRNGDTRTRSSGVTGHGASACRFTTIWPPLHGRG